MMKKFDVDGDIIEAEKFDVIDGMAAFYNHIPLTEFERNLNASGRCMFPERYEEVARFAAGSWRKVVTCA